MRRVARGSVGRAEKQASVRDTFIDRVEAGRLLAARLAGMALVDPVIIALPRGGVPVAAEIADALHAPLDLLVVRKIGAPTDPEVAVAAIAEDMAEPQVSETWRLELAGARGGYVERATAAQRLEIARRRHAYLHDRPPLPLAGRTVVVVDDGVATGATLRAALGVIRRRGPGRLVVALPVAPRDVLQTLQDEVDDVVCLRQPVFFRAVGDWYEDFHQVCDDEVIALLRSRQAAR